MLGRLFASSADIASVSEDEQDQKQSSPPAGDNTCGSGTPRTKGTNGAPPISGAPHGYYMPPAPAKVAYPGLIDRYCGGVSKGRNGGASVGRRACWLDSDDKTCAALELDVHALAMLVFVEWREFVSALPGCGAVLSKETSSLWFAQVMSYGSYIQEFSMIFLEGRGGLAGIMLAVGGSLCVCSRPTKSRRSFRPAGLLF